MVIVPIRLQVPWHVNTSIFLPDGTGDNQKYHLKKILREPILDAEYMVGNILEDTLENWLLDYIPEETLNVELSQPALEVTLPSSKHPTP